MQIPNCPYCGKSVSAYRLDAHLASLHDIRINVSGSRCAFCLEAICSSDTTGDSGYPPDKEQLWSEHLNSCNAFAAFLLTGKVAYEAD